MSKWTHVVHTYEKGESRIYVNGMLDGIHKTDAAPLAIKSPAHLFLGGWYHNYDFVGDLDEVRISNVVRSPDWIRLQYENQKPMQTLVSTLRSLALIDASANEEADLVTQVTRSVGSLKSEISDLKSSIATHARQRAESFVDTAVRAGRIAAKDSDTRGFWADAILRDESKAIVIPSEAVHWDGCCNVVFVRDKDYLKDGSPKVFHVRTVRVGAKDGKNTEIIAGVVPGELVVTRGSTALRAELLKNNLGEGCTCGK